jgi:hypothetical protein
MATQTNQMYHLEKQRTAMKQTRDFIHTNSLADSRRRDPSFKGTPGNPRANGERANVFMAVPQNHKPLSELSGGVLQDDAYRRQILEQRKRDYEIQEAIQESLPLPPVQAPALSEEDAKKLELNSLLDQLYETINSNVQEVSSVGELLRKINRLVLQLAATMDSGDIGELLDVFTDLLTIVISKISDKTPSSPLDAEPVGALRFMERALTALTGFLKDISGSVSRGEKDFRLAIQSAAKRHFGKEAMKLVTPSLKSTMEVYSSEADKGKKRVTKEDIILEITGNRDVTAEEIKNLKRKTVAQLRDIARRTAAATARSVEPSVSASATAAPVVEGEGMSGGMLSASIGRMVDAEKRVDQWIADYEAGNYSNIPREYFAIIDGAYKRMEMETAEGQDRLRKLIAQMKPYGPKRDLSTSQRRARKSAAPAIPTLTVTEMPNKTDPAAYALRTAFPPQKIRRRKGGADDEDPVGPREYTEEELIEMIAQLIHERDGLIADTNPATAAARGKRRKEITKLLRKYKDLLGDMADDPSGGGRRRQKKKTT